MDAAAQTARFSFGAWTRKVRAMASARKSPRPTFSDFKPETLRGAAGFVRLGQTHRGQWWLLDANGRPFFSRGVTGVRRSAPSRRATAPESALPAEKPLENPVFEEDVTSVLRRLRTWHLDTVGVGTAPEFFERGIHYTVSLDFRKRAPAAAIKLGGALLPDVFDPRWIEACDVVAAEICGLRRNSEQLIGYFTDHELGWAQPDAEALSLQVNLAPKTAPRIERPTPAANLSEPRAGVLRLSCGVGIYPGRACGRSRHPGPGVGHSAAEQGSAAAADPRGNAAARRQLSGRQRTFLPGIRAELISPPARRRSAVTIRTT